MSNDSLKAQATNVRNTREGGMRTGNSVEAAPVKVYIGPGPTTLPHTADWLAPIQHPEPKAQ